MAAEAPVWRSERSVLWTAKEGTFLTAIPCIVNISNDAITVERWFSPGFLLLNLGLLGALRLLRGNRSITIPAGEVSTLRFEKTWIDNQIARKRFEGNSRLLYRMSVERSGTDGVKLKVFLRKADLQQIQNVPWIKAVAVGP